MKLNEVMQGDTPSPILQSPDFLDFVNKVKRECSEYLSVARTPHYRGMSANARFGDKNIRQDRAPRESPIDQTTLFNEAAERVFGIEDVRNRSMYMTTKREDAEMYGTVFVVFPRNDSEYLICRDDDSIGIVAEMREGDNDFNDKLVEEMFIYLESPTSILNNSDSEIMVFDSPRYYYLYPEILSGAELYNLFYT